MTEHTQPHQIRHEDSGTPSDEHRPGDPSPCPATPSAPAAMGGMATGPIPVVRRKQNR
ncbi:hypothetical protein HGQ17_05730 [Nesterenkonia sp. MY13]|uniref:Uncharacterized protein n=1 Tax=Nesterenkonia sedimenti TaxID=1463632 RepID=A0A7X8TIQ5_9MICC|nr:hypothetical protein [Nesterenkonia sedimenti]NLS09515.1 hypothetical protein [Nesterenkonia sedimenti]